MVKTAQSLWFKGQKQFSVTKVILGNSADISFFSRRFYGFGFLLLSLNQARPFISFSRPGSPAAALLSA